MAFLVKGRSIAAVAEASYGASVVFADTDYVDYTAADLSTDIENIDREVIRNSLVSLEPILGQETSSGSITVELSGEDAISGVNGDLLFTNGIGKKLAGVTGLTVTAAVDASNFTVSDASGLAQGQALKVSLTGGDEYTIIATVDTGTGDVTVSPALSGTPTVTDVVAGLTTYILPRPNDTIASLAIREHLANQAGSTIDYDYSGVMVSDVALDFPVGGICTAVFSTGGAGFSTTSPGSTITLPCDTYTPAVGKNAVLSVMGTAYTAQDVSMSVSTEITDINSITTDGISNKLGISKEVTGSFRTEYTGTDNFDAFKAGTTGETILLLRDGGATSPVIVGAYMPQIKFTNVSRSDDGGVLYDTVEFMALSPDCDNNERAFSLFFD
jgi:hypothetical protein